MNFPVCLFITFCYNFVSANMCYKGKLLMSREQHVDEFSWEEFMDVVDVDAFDHVAVTHLPRPEWQRRRSQ